MKSKTADITSEGIVEAISLNRYLEDNYPGYIDQAAGHISDFVNEGENPYLLAIETSNTVVYGFAPGTKESTRDELSKAIVNEYLTKVLPECSKLMGEFCKKYSLVPMVSINNSGTLTAHNFALRQELLNRTREILDK